MLSVLNFLSCKMMNRPLKRLKPAEVHAAQWDTVWLLSSPHWPSLGLLPVDDDAMCHTQDISRF